MDNTIKVYKEEKELREKRLVAYAELLVPILQLNYTNLSKTFIWYLKKQIQHWNYFDKACLHGFRRKNMMK